MQAKASIPRYRGRFAPSPTGHLHFGSLIAAVGSYLDARAHQGEWLVRIEDIDPPREVKGASSHILATLESLGMEWDGPVLYQRQRGELYAAAMERLERGGHLYGCACTRKEITGAIYPGTCRAGIPPGRKARSLRVHVGDSEVCLTDILQGRIHQHLGEEVGDFILRRADQLVAYQLAVVIDDAEQQISHIVRGADLLDSTPRQIYLQQLLGLPTPEYLHLPVAVNRGGDKLSKQSQAREIHTSRKITLLVDTLRFLGQDPPHSLMDASLDELWGWAMRHWDANAIPAARTRAAPAAYVE